MPTHQLLGIHHVTAIAGDPSTNAQFYTGVLGFRVRARDRVPQTPMGPLDLVYLELGGTTVELMCYPEATVGPRALGGGPSAARRPFTCIAGANGVGKSNLFDAPSLLANAAPEPPGLTIPAHVWEVARAVVAEATSTPGGACPAPSQAAVRDTTHVMTICGRNHAKAALTPVAGQSSLAGTFVAGAGTMFQSGSWTKSVPTRVQNKFETKDVLMPKGPSGKRVTSIWNWGFPINAALSEKAKRATWLFIMWASSAETQARTSWKFAGPAKRSGVNRSSVWRNADFTAFMKQSGHNFVEAALASLDQDTDVNWRPRVPQWPAIGDTMATAIQAALVGQKPSKAALDEAQARIDQIMKG